MVFCFGDSGRIMELGHEKSQATERLILWLPYPQMSPNRTPDEPICVETEVGDSVGFVSEDAARFLLKCHKARLRCNPAKRIRSVVLIASEDEPLRGKSRAIAAAGYTGHEKYTYDETLPKAGHSIVMLKRHRPECGDFVRW